MKPLNSDQIREASFIRNNFAVTCDHGTQWEDVLNPLFWVHVAQKIKAYDIIEVRALDKSFWGELLVMSATKDSVNVVELRHHDFSVKKQNAKVNNDFFTEFNEKEKWRVIRKFDKKVIESGFDTAKEAGEYIKILSEEKAA